MFTAMTNGGPLVQPRWSATATMRRKTRPGDQAHTGHRWPMLEISNADVLCASESGGRRADAVHFS